MRVLLADDQPEVRSALRLLLEHEPGLVPVGEVGDAAGLLARVRATRPDLVLLDWELPGLNTCCVVASLRSCCPGLRAIALSGRPEARQSALRAGVDGFVSKGDPPERLLAEIRAAGGLT